MNIHCLSDLSLSSSIRCKSSISLGHILDKTSQPSLVNKISSSILDANPRYFSGISLQLIGI